MLALFRITLGQDGLGMEADFFASGGDSIKAALLIAQLSRQLSAYMYVVALLRPSHTGRAGGVPQARIRGRAGRRWTW